LFLFFVILVGFLFCFLFFNILTMNVVLYIYI
jgi:hypothetical protein